MREWVVAGGLLESADGLLLVRNHRRGGHVDWTPPGGVVDAGETVVDGLTREVHEETGLVVETWNGPAYVVHAEATDMQWHLHAEIYVAEGFSGDVAVGDDPDGIVTAARFVAGAEIAELVALGPRWVREPLLDWLLAPERCSDVYRYEVRGTTPESYEVERL